jgi:hypothetical protein
VQAAQQRGGIGPTFEPRDSIHVIWLVRHGYWRGRVPPRDCNKVESRKSSEVFSRRPASGERRTLVKTREVCPDRDQNHGLDGQREVFIFS